MKTLNIELEDQEYTIIEKDKNRRGQTWRQYIFNNIERPITDAAQLRLIEIMDSLARVQKALEEKAMVQLNAPEPKQPGVD